MRLVTLSILAGLFCLLAPFAGQADSQPQLYPNPVDLGSLDANAQRLHFDQVEPGSTAEIFNLAGEAVIKLTLKGDFRQDFWDCVNSNGTRVVTGVYVIMIRQPSGKKSVQRAAIIWTR